MVTIETVENKFNLKVEQMGNSTYYYCPIDGQLLLVVDNDGRFGLKNSCEHYNWESMSITSFIGFSRLVNNDEISKMRHESVIRIYDFFSVYLLLNAQS